MELQYTFFISVIPKRKQIWLADEEQNQVKE